MLFAGILDFVIGDIYKSWLGLMLSLDSLVYSFIDIMFRLFVVVSKARIFSVDLFGDLVRRFYIIFSVVMLFVIAYQLLKAIANPDSLSKGDTSGGKMVGNVVTSLVIIAILPWAFNLLFQAQDVVLDNNLIGKVFIGGNDYDADSLNGVGAEMAMSVFDGFFYGENGLSESEIIPKDDFSTSFIETVINASLGPIGVIKNIYNVIQFFLEEKVPLSDAKEEIVETAKSNNIITLKPLAIYTQNILDDEVHYSWFLSTIVGIIVAYLLLTFSIDMGIRAVKLCFLQIIAPIPVLFRIIPSKKDVFNKWVKLTVNTFLEMFIRLAVIYLAVAIIRQLPDILSAIWGSTSQSGAGFVVMLLARVILIMGLLAFCRQASKMICDLFGIDAGSLNFGLKDKLAAGGALAAGAAIGGGVTSAVRGFRENKGGGFSKVLSAGRGLVSGGARAGFNARNAKTYADVKAAASKGASGAAAARARRREEDEYLRSQGYTGHNPVTAAARMGHRISGAATGVMNTVGDWASPNQGIPLTAQEQKQYDVAKQFKSDISGLENLWKDEKAYKDQNAALTQAKAAKYANDSIISKYNAAPPTTSKERAEFAKAKYLGKQGGALDMAIAAEEAKLKGITATIQETKKGAIIAKLNNINNFRTANALQKDIIGGGMTDADLEALTNSIQTGSAMDISNALNGFINTSNGGKTKATARVNELDAKLAASRYQAEAKK